MFRKVNIWGLEKLEDLKQKYFNYFKKISNFIKRLLKTRFRQIYTLFRSGAPLLETLSDCLSLCLSVCVSKTGKFQYGKNFRGYENFRIKSAIILAAKLCKFAVVPRICNSLKNV